MTEIIKKNKEESIKKANEVVDKLFKETNLKDGLSYIDQEMEEQLTPTLSSIILSKDETDIKKHFKELIGKLKEKLERERLKKTDEEKEIVKKVGDAFYKEDVFKYYYRFYNPDGKVEQNTHILKAPILFVEDNDPNGETNLVYFVSSLLPMSSDYNSEVQHYSYLATVLSDVEEVMKRMVNIAKNESYKNYFKNTYFYKTLEQSEDNSIESVPYYKFLLSELFIEEIPKEDIDTNSVRIEFGQTDSRKRSKDKVSLATGSTLAFCISKLADRIAQSNVNMILSNNLDKKIYLENTGVSADEIIEGNYKHIERYEGKDKINKDAGYIVVEKAEYGPDGKIYRKSTRVPVKLELPIVKLEERRLEKIREKLTELLTILKNPEEQGFEENREKFAELEEKITKEWIMTNGKMAKILMEENSNIENSFDNEKQRHSFIEEIRREQEIAYIDNKDFFSSQTELRSKRKVQQIDDDSERDMYGYGQYDDEEIEISHNEKIKKKERKGRNGETKFILNI